MKRYKNLLLTFLIITFCTFMTGCVVPIPENLDAVKAFEPFDEVAEQMLLQNGFVVLGDIDYNRLSDLYFSLFLDDTGVSTFITTDALLHVFHITYDDLLETAERVWLIPKNGRTGGHYEHLHKIRVWEIIRKAISKRSGQTIVGCLCSWGSAD